MNNLKSNWMTNAAPTLYRAASKGKVFTRAERLAIITAGKAKAERLAKRMEVIREERTKARQESEKTRTFFNGVRLLTENAAAPLRKGKDGLFIQPRVKGSFGPKITL